jgi:peptidoglycan/xylan/chitin deacetylase (PgdA/CDA1 family)
MINALAPSLVGSLSLLLCGGAAAYYATYAVRSQWLGRTDWHGRRDTKAIALTFDDGPSHDTDRILDILAEHNLRATFFLIGRQVERFPQAARRIATEGHTVGNHSYSHPIYLYRSPSETHRQLKQAQEVISEATGIRPVFARPPCGVRTPAYFSGARSLGLRTVQWDVSGFDWKGNPPRIIARNVLRRVRAGSIILLHDGDSESKHDRRATAEALPLIITGLLSRGLCVVPLAELFSQDNHFRTA